MSLFPFSSVSTAWSTAVLSPRQNACSPALSCRPGCGAPFFPASTWLGGALCDPFSCGPALSWAPELCAAVCLSVQVQRRKGRTHVQNWCDSLFTKLAPSVCPLFHPEASSLVLPRCLFSCHPYTVIRVSQRSPALSSAISFESVPLVFLGWPIPGTRLVFFS